MRVKLQWLKDFIDIKSPVDIDLLSKYLNLAGLEVEGVNSFLDASKKVSVAPVMSITSLGNALSCKLLFQEKEIEITVPSETEIEVGDYLAFIADNNFVACLWSYFGFDNQKTPIVLKQKDVTESLINKLSDLAEFDDYVIELGVTPNRPDALNHLGVSREIAALMDLDLKAPMLTVKEMGGAIHERAAVEIVDSNDASRYSCRVIDNIKIGESPWWLKFRLLSCGIKPINNVVDVTNYVMLSRGQPLHAFDYNKLAKDGTRTKIFVRKAKLGETFTTLDNKKINLDEDDLVIADNQGPVALAGIIGGLNSKVDENTTSILLESAYFNPTSVRNSAKKHDISTESSFRFERGMDPNAVVDALNYAARLIVETNASAVACRDVIDVYRSRIDPVEVKLRPEKAIRLLGIPESDFDQDLIRKRFVKLGIETVAKRGDAIYFRIPSFRPDITREIDLIEESARMIGLDKILSSEVSYEQHALPFTDKNCLAIASKLRDFLVYRGFNEAINYSFLAKAEAVKFLPDNKSADDLITVKNPLSERYEIMRPTLIAGLVKNLKHNVRNQEKSVRLFELGATYFAKKSGVNKATPNLLVDSMDVDSFAIEKQKIAAILYGEDILQGYDTSNKENDFYHLKGVVLDALGLFGLSDFVLKQNLFFQNDSIASYFHPNNSLSIYCQQKEEKVFVGQMGELHPDILKEEDIKKKAFAFEIDLGLLSMNISHKKTFKPFSRFPSIERDLALLVDESLPISDIIALCGKLKDNANIASVKIFDIYRGKNIPANKKSVALSFTLQSNEQTLKDEDAQKVMDEFIALSQKDLGATVRS